MAREKGMEAAAVTFESHPRAYVRGRAPDMINTFPSRCDLLKQAGAKEPRAKVQWNDRMTLKLDRPVKLQLCGERGRGPGSGIGQLVFAQVMQIAALWFGEVGILFFVLSLLWVVTGILDICKCGPRTVVSFLAEPGKRYWLHWTDYERMQCEEDHAVEE